MQKNYDPKELDKLKKCYKSMISHTRHVRDDDEYYEASIAREKKLIEEAQKRLQTIVETRENADSIIEEAQKRIKELNKHRALADKGVVARLQRIQRKLNELGYEAEDLQPEEAHDTEVRTAEA